MLISIFLKSFCLLLENNIRKKDLSFYWLFLASDDHAYIFSALWELVWVLMKVCIGVVPKNMIIVANLLTPWKIFCPKKSASKCHNLEWAEPRGRFDWAPLTAIIIYLTASLEAGKLTLVSEACWSSCTAYMVRAIEYQSARLPLTTK